LPPAPSCWRFISDVSFPRPATAHRSSLFPIIPGTIVLALSPQSVVAVAAIFGMAWIHHRGVGPGRLVGNVLATLKVSAFVIFIALGFSIGQGDVANITQAAGPVPAASWLLALIPVMFTYSGWNAASYVAEEIKDPGRNVPRALALGTSAVIALYLLLNALYLYVVPVGQLATIKGSMLDFIADRLLGAVAGNIMAVVSIISLLASISAMTFAGPRVYFAMARDGVFFKSAASVHQRYRTPAVAIFAQAVWSSLLVLTAQADALVNYTGFAIVLFSGVAVVALFVLRAKQPDAERPFRAWGYPVAPGIYAVVSFAILANSLYSGPAAIGAGALIIAAGVPVYFFFRHRN
jgi:APA family basic amino acid/polyamine antiporter